MTASPTFGAQLRRGDEVGYFLGYVTDQYSAGETDIRVFRFTSDGDPSEERTRARRSGWTPSGQKADRIMLARMNVWQAEQDLMDELGSMEVCQKCGGHVGAKDDFDRCLCKTPTLWRSRRAQRASSEPDSDYEAMADDEWDDMYPDVIEDLCLHAARVPSQKLTVELFQRIVRHEVTTRQSLAHAWEDDEDFNRVWAVMLERIGRDPHPHLKETLRRLPAVRAAIVKCGGKRYAEGKNALGRREVELMKEALDVDENWNRR